MKPISSMLALCLVLFVSSSAMALITGGIGNDPVSDAGWPRGAVDLANLKSRVAWWEGPPFGGGQYQFLYRGDTEAFQAALDLFSKMRTPVRELMIHDGPQESWYLQIDRRDDKKVDARIDWTFTVWIPANWHRLYSGPNAFFAEDPNLGKPLDPPRIDVYINPAGAGAGQIDWSKVKAPANVRIIDKRAAAAGVKVTDGAVLHVNAYDMATGKPVEGAVLRLTDTQGKIAEVTASANADGFIEQKRIPAATYQLTLEAPGYATRIIAYENLGATAFRTFDIELSKAATLGGSVVDSAGKPLAGVTIHAKPIGIDGRGYNQPQRPVKTDAHGRFELTGLPTGYTQLKAFAQGHHQLDLLKVQPIPATEVRIEMAATGAIKGQVRGKDGKAPAAGTNIFIVPEGGPKVGKWSASGKVGADGSFEFKNVPTGRYYASTQHYHGRADVSKDATLIEVTAGKTADVVVEAK